MQVLTNPKGFRTVIDMCLFKPRMLQCLFGGDPLLGIVDEDPLQEIQKLLVEIRRRWNEFLY